MDIKEYIAKFIPETDSPEKVYELFRGLKYPKDKVLDPTYKRKIQEFDLAKEEKEKVKDIYTVFNYDGKLQIFLIETKTLSLPLVRYLAKRLSDRYLRFLLILTADFKEYAFIFPEFERVEEGKHKLKLTRLIFDRENPYHTDLLTLSNIALTGDEENWRDIWRKWKDAFSVEKVTNEFFEDYTSAFFELRKTFAKQKLSVKEAHELSQQFLNRLMFLYFISKKRWLDDDPKFIRWYWQRYKEEKRNGNAKKDTFYENWLRILFLEAFNNKYSHPHYHPQDIKKILASAPYLNGGLFHKNDLDDLPSHISDSLFEKVFNFFEKYNFTIREDLPLDVEVAVDPQMIGYVYESLSNAAEGVYERQDLGIFYTPVIEVDFMCRRTLVEYLTNHLTELPKEQIYRLLFDEDKKSVEDYITKKNLWYRLEEVLENLAAVDPACGSGAFLVGMLHVLIELYRLTYRHIKRDMTTFELKKKIIGSSLYGVDVMPWSVHSAELRLWLQLIIEEDIPYDQRKLFPLLPNLNLRLRVGDSLVQEVGGVGLHIRDSRLSPSIKRKLSAIKTEKEKYYNNDPTAKFKSDTALLHEELRIFCEILEDKAITLKKEIQVVEGRKQQNQPEMFEEFKKKEMEQKTLFEEQIKTKESEIENLRETKKNIQAPGKKPFVWDIDFAEIFGDKGGFDIVIGNPPYVRQEKIAPPNKLKTEVTLEDKRGYKDKLLKSIQAHFPFIQKIDKKSDYYIYFYFHGLSLLNEKGTFCFITSNSWLDVGYGKDLQKFLLKYCPIKAIYDNQAKRSFEHADVNTIIALFGPPQTSYPPFRKGGRGGIWPALENTARFVMFKRPFEEVINTKNLLATENTETIRKTESYRVFPVKQETLLDEGWEYPEVRLESKDREQKPEGKTVIARSGATKQSQKRLLKEKFQTGKYEGNKWGGKYLRAPDIFFNILEKGKGKLVRLGDIAEVRRGFTTGCNEFFYLDDEKIRKWGIEKEFLKPVIRSPRECNTISISPKELPHKIFMCNKDKKNLKSTKALNYIKWGESKGFHKTPSCKGRRKWWELDSTNIGNIIWLKLPRQRLVCFYSKEAIGIDCNMYSIKSLYDLAPILNSSNTFFFAEQFGQNIGGGGGIRPIMVSEIKKLIVLDITKLTLNQQSIIREAFNKLSQREIHTIFAELGISPNLPIREQKPNPLPDRKALDDVVFDILGLTQEERNEVYWSVCELVKNRLEKARSI